MSTQITDQLAKLIEENEKSIASMQENNQKRLLEQASLKRQLAVTAITVCLLGIIMLICTACAVVKRYQHKDSIKEQTVIQMATIATNKDHRAILFASRAVASDC